MLDNLNGSGENEILERISRSRKEPEGQPEVISEESEAEEVELEELEDGTPDEPELLGDSEESDDPDHESDDEEPGDLFIDLDGEEVSLSQIKEWKEGNLRQSDYTRKTMELAESRKAIEAAKSKQEAVITELDDTIAVMKDLLSEEFDKVDWDELRDYDTAEYLKLKDLKASRENLISQAKEKREAAQRQLRDEMLQSESQALAKALQWDDAKKREKDVSLIQKYIAESGWSEKEVADIVNHKHMAALLDAAKYRELKSKAPEVSKKVKKAPTAVKGKRATQTALEKQVSDADAKFRRTGKLEDAMALRKLKRQLKG